MNSTRRTVARRRSSPLIAPPCCCSTAARCRGDPAQARAAPLTNLAHLDFLTDLGDAAAAAPATPPTGCGEPDGRRALGLRRRAKPDGTFKRVGGGDLRPGDQHLRAGRLRRRRHRPRRRRLPAALAAVRRRAQPGAGLPLLRGLTYLQTATGPNGGKVVLWMQPDGTLTRAPTPPELARPVRLRTVVLAGPHALGARRGLRRLPRHRPGLRRLPARLALRPGRRRAATRRAHPLRPVPDHPRAPVPAWLIVNGADATSEAVLGPGRLRPSRRVGARRAPSAAPARRGHRRDVRRIDRRLAVRRAAAVGAVPIRWHAWGAQMPSALWPRPRRRCGSSPLAATRRSPTPPASPRC